MARNLLVVSNQNRPAEFLNRKFINRQSLMQASRVADDAQKTPSVSQVQALGLVAVAAIRLRTAQLGVAQANDANVAGSVASWAAELTAANTAMDIALKALKTVHPSIQLPATVVSVIDANVAGASAPGPSQLSATWANAIKANY